VARSFGRCGVTVLLITDDHPLPKLSRYVRRSFDWPGASSPHVDKWLINFANEHGLRDWLLIPCADAEVKFVATHVAGLRSVFKVVSSDWAALNQVCDKRNLAKTAAAAGVDFPEDYPIGSAYEAECVKVRFPVVLKPAMRLQRNEFTSSKAWRADCRDELKQLYGRAAALVGKDQVVMQELIPGGGASQFSYAALWYQNAPVAEMTACRTRQFPLEFSHTSTFVEVVDNDAVKAAGRRLLKLIGFEGLVEIEFKWDMRDGSYKVLDVNPRPWSWFALCPAAGLDLPILMRNIVLGKSADPIHPRAGHVWVHFSKDILAAVQLMSRGDLNAFAYFSSICRKVTFAAFDWDDPLPGILELPLMGYRLLRRAFGGAATFGATLSARTRFR
jgi:predicted ATP-grasp superfamily ATP-dependent carboligase